MPFVLLRMCLIIIRILRTHVFCRSAVETPGLRQKHIDNDTVYCLCREQILMLCEKRMVGRQGIFLPVFSS